MNPRNREFLMLAKEYVPGQHHINGWLYSEKLDGQRCFWDGGVSRGRYIRSVPYANHGNKSRLIGRATGLWSRYGNVICAPDWFIDGLPNNIMLDGELYLGPDCLQETRSIVSRHVPDDRWRAINFHVFDTPSVDGFTTNGLINNPNFSRRISQATCLKFLDVKEGDLWAPNFLGALNMLKEMYLPHYVTVVEQKRLPFQNYEEVIYDELKRVTEAGGEGLMLRRPYSYWAPYRDRNLLKVKPIADDEALVIGYKPGLGKYTGMLGSLIVTWRGEKFDLSGMSDEERVLRDEKSVAFPVGTIVTFRYNGVTKDGIPREARYWRTRSCPD